MQNSEKPPSNIYAAIPADISSEIFQDLVKSPNVRIERILSKGHISPDFGWYDQDESEWVMVMEGKATIAFEDGRSVSLSKGDHLNIPPHCKHKVSWSDPHCVTIWLAVFYR